MSRLIVFNVEGVNKSNNNFNAPSPPDPNKILCFDTKAESDEEIVYSSAYKLNLPIDTLIKNSDDSQKKGNDAPRRLNAWILYRKDKRVLPQFEGLKSSIISVEIAKMWNTESNEVREYFAALSRLAEKWHIEKYGKDYRYQPKKSKNKIKQKKVKLAVANRPKQQPSPASSNININSPSTPSSSGFEAPSQFFPTPKTSNYNSPVIPLVDFEANFDSESGTFFSHLSDITRSSLKSSPNLPEFVLDTEELFSSLEFEQPSPEFVMDTELFPTPTTHSSLEFEQPSPILPEFVIDTELFSTPTTHSSLEFEQPSPILPEFVMDAELFPTPTTFTTYMPTDLSELIMNAENISTSKLSSFTIPPGPFEFEESPIQHNNLQQYGDWLLFSDFPYQMDFDFSNFDNVNDAIDFQNELDDQSAIPPYGKPSL